MGVKTGPDAEWRRKLANDAEANIDHPLVKLIVDEYVDNMKRNHGVDLAAGLPSYGLHKCLATAMIVARADALGIDPEVLRYSRIPDFDKLGAGDISRITAAAADGVQIPDAQRITLPDPEPQS